VLPSNSTDPTSAGGLRQLSPSRALPSQACQAARRKREAALARARDGPSTPRLADLTLGRAEKRAFDHALVTEIAKVMQILAWKCR
jgi:hypothetical protein